MEEQQFLSYRLFDTESGLRAQQITGVFKDTLGYHWVADAQGLHQYYGDGFKFLDRNTLGLSGNKPFHAFSDTNGIIWLISKHVAAKVPEYAAHAFTSSHLCIDQVILFNPYEQSSTSLENYFESLPFEIDNIYTITQAGGKIMVSTLSGGLYSLNNGYWVEEIQPAQFGVISVASYSPSGNTLFFVTEQKLYQYHNGNYVFITHLPFNPQAIRFLDGLIILYSPFNRMIKQYYCYDLATRREVDWGAINPFPSRFLTIFAQKKEIWDITGNHLRGYQYHRQNNEMELVFEIPILSFFSNNRAPTHGTMLDDNLWIFSHRQVCVVNPELNNFTTYPATEECSIRGIKETSNATLVLTTYSGLKEVDTNNGKTITISPYNVGFGICVDENNYFLGSHGTLIRKLNRKNGHQKDYYITPNEPYAKYFHPAIDKKGRLWVASDRGLHILDTQTGFLKHKKIRGHRASSLNKATINAVIEDNDNTWWLPTNRGIFHFDPLNERVLDTVLMGRNIISVYPGNQDEIWCIPYSDNPFLYNRKNRHIEEVSIFKEKWLNKFHAIIPGAKGYYWLSSDNGLFQYDPVSGRVERMTLEQYNLPSSEFNKLAWHVQENSTIALGGINGLMTFDPTGLDLISHTLNKEKKLFSNVIAANSKNEKLEYKAEGTNQFTFLSGTTSIIVDFECSDILSNSNSYYYRLRKSSDKQEKAWEKLIESVVKLDNISHGAYVLEIGAKSELDQKMQASDLLFLTLPPPWYLNPLFITLGVLSLLVLGHAGNNLRIRRLKRRQKSLEEVILQRTAELRKDKAVISQQKARLEKTNMAKDKLMGLLVHELKAPLMSVMGLCEASSQLVLQNDIEALQKISTQLDGYSINLQSRLDRLLEWGQVMIGQNQVRPKELDIQKVVDIVLKELLIMTKTKNIQFQIFIPDMSIVVIDRESLLVIIRNLVENAIKFSFPEGIVTISFDKMNEQHWQLSISDHGKGLPPKLKTHWNKDNFFYSTRGTAGERGYGLGLQLCFALAERNGCQLKYDENRAEGARISLVKEL